MNLSKIFIFSLAVNLFCSSFLFAQEIKVCIHARGTTGIEDDVKNILQKEFESYEHVTVTDTKEDCHLYLDLAVVEQRPIRFYAIGVSIAYRIKDRLYSRPTADVAQFGEGRAEEVMRYLAKEIDKAFLSPLRSPSGRTVTE